MNGRAGKYGIDAPYVPALTAAGALIFLVWGFFNSGIGVWICWIMFVVLTYQFFQYMYCTMVGKFRVWDDLLDGLTLQGNEQVLDIGCGRGLVVNAAAARLTSGKATGIDLWRSVDQSGNSQDVTMANAQAEGVADRVVLETGDMTSLPFADNTFDVVVSSTAVHNVTNAEGRAAAIREAYRVLKPGGRIEISDIKHAGEYQQTLQKVGAKDVAKRGLGPRFWFGGPWMSSALVTATK